MTSVRTPSGADAHDVTGADAREVAIWVFDGCAMLDVAGPADVLATASRVSAGPGYRIVVASPDGRPVRSDSGITIGADLSFAQAAAREDIDTVLVVGGLETLTVARDPAHLADLRTASQRARRTTAVCTGALVLAAAGLLDGYRATTHWISSDYLRKGYPRVEVEPDRIFVRDRDRWTSAGVTAGIDLALALVEADHDRAVAHMVATALVVFVRRPGGQAQFSAQLRAQPARVPVLAELQRWLPDNLAQDVTVDALARRAGMTPRTFARQFRQQTGTTPAVFVAQLRVESAKRLLCTTELTVAAIASRVGFGNPETLHRAFTRALGTTPQRYRDHFTSSSS
ncbi:GlxA family transcriptional regulator [Nocardia jejuensis]|uniref:GlxA family transcriptional regulator n=1 Tax=Nocardia jejuensis TaxID=328049 RepID=UPI00082D859F|nr:GlxA family transcriptional regulator [Nocardia jejuensis]